MMSYLKQIKGNIVYRNSADYNEKRLVWNRRINRFPYYIIYPTDKEDIEVCFKLIKDFKLPFRIRNGGHSYEGYSTLNNGIIIDMSLLNKITIDEKNGQVIVQGGVKNEELYNALTEKGYVFPGGDCKNVGVSGFTLGGGFGYSSRFMGLGVDQVSKIELINDRGETLIANEEINPDLFWACRGAGQGNFGIVTKLTYKLPPKIKEVVYITMEAKQCDFTSILNVFELWQDWLENLDNRMTFTIRFERNGKKINMYGTGLFYGSTEEAKEIMKGYTLKKDLEIKYQRVTFKEFIQKIMNQIPAHEKMCDIGLFNYQKYNRFEMEDILSILKQEVYHTTITLYSWGGKIKEVGIDKTAFYHRKANYLIGVRTVWEKESTDTENLVYMCNCYYKLKKYTKGAYVNHPYSNLMHYMNDYYGSHVNKLCAIKNKYDPDHFFDFEQAIK
ncbi:MAG: FAD-binding protein [Bacilli bacterium]|nr:FAD-binding protein [Bacilli bacterium]